MVATPQYLFALVRTHKTTENRFLDVPDGLVTSEQDPDHYRDAWLRLNLPRADEHKFCIYFGVWPSGTVTDDTALRLRYIPS